MSDTERAEALAATTVAIMTTRCAQACAYAEAYGHEGRIVVVDGSQYAPSTRALPHGGRAWNEESEFFSLWDDAVSDALDQLTVQCTDNDAQRDDPEYAWTFSWEEGCLFAIHPDHEDETLG